MKRIFFVEDDLSLIHGLSFALRQQGYEVVNARTCLEAETLWQDGSFDLVILDVPCPTARLRSVPQAPPKLQSAHSVLTAADEEPTLSWGWTSAATIISPSRSSWDLPVAR